jgi:hypothetical protein
LKNKKNSKTKSPGSDSFTVEFFKHFWLQIGPLVVRSLNEGFRKQELSTQKEGVIICIPKDDKSKDLIKNTPGVQLHC